MNLSAAQKRFLRQHGHALKPVVMIGDKGLTDNVMAEIELGLAHHELIKVRINAGDHDERDEMIDTICQSLNSALVNRIGHIGLFYRRHKDKPKLALPKS